MSCPHSERAQRIVRYHSAPLPKSSAMVICSVGFPVTFVRRTGRPTPSLDFEIFCRRFAPIIDDFELDLLTFIEGREAGSLHRRDMNEHVLSAPLRLDEAVAFGGVEPLYVSCCHLSLLRKSEPRTYSTCTFPADYTRLNSTTCFRPANMTAADQRINLGDPARLSNMSSYPKAV